MSHFLLRYISFNQTPISCLWVNVNYIATASRDRHMKPHANSGFVVLAEGVTMVNKNCDSWCSGLPVLTYSRYLSRVCKWHTFLMTFMTLSFESSHNNVPTCRRHSGVVNGAQFWTSSSVPLHPLSMFEKALIVCKFFFFRIRNKRLE